MNRFNIKSKKGFTLIELLVVIGILAVLAAIAIPTVAGLIDRANVSADETNANEMTNAVERFASEYELYCQDIASGKIKDTTNLDSAQGRVYNVTGATTRADIEKLEGTAGLNGRAINRDTKYPVNAETMQAIVENYTKTSSATFEPKQSDMHYWYSPDCGIVVFDEPDASKDDLNGQIVSGKDAKGNTLDGDTEWIDMTLTTAASSGVAVADKVYTLEEIEADEHLYAIGATKPEYVVAKFNDDYTELTIFANGNESDGQMQDFAVWSPNMPSPMTVHKDTLTTVTVKEGIVNFGAGGGGRYPFSGCSNVTKITLPSTIQRVGNSAFTNIANGSVIDCATAEVAQIIRNNKNSYTASTTTITPEIPEILTFTLDMQSYQFEKGMTWAEWIDSPYNTVGLQLVSPESPRIMGPDGDTIIQLYTSTPILKEKVTKKSELTNDVVNICTPTRLSKNDAVLPVSYNLSELQSPFIAIDSNGLPSEEATAAHVVYLIKKLGYAMYFNTAINNYELVYVY